MSQSVINTASKISAELCPFAAIPLPECHCMGMNSHKIALVVKYCMVDYHQCEIYRQCTGQEKQRRN